MDAGKTDRALYETIAAELLDGMSSGRYPVGSLLPTEAELGSAYGVSRQTVRAAMRHLLEVGAISRRKGIGTRVEPRGKPDAGYSQTLATLDDLLSLAEGTRRDIRSMEPTVLDRRQAKALGAKPGTRWLKISYVRLPVDRKADPIGWSDVFIDERYAGIGPRIASHHGLISDLIEQQYGVLVTQVEQEIAAVELAAPLAAALRAKAGVAALRVKRRYLDKRGAPIEIVVATHPGDRCTMSSTLQRIR